MNESSNILTMTAVPDSALAGGQVDMLAQDSMSIEQAVAGDTLSRADSVAYGIRLMDDEESVAGDLWERSFFGQNQYFQTGLQVAENGVPGEPIPYTVSHDDTIAGLLLGCFFVILIGVSLSRDFLLRQSKNFFYVPRSVAETSTTTTESRALHVLVLHTSVLLGMLCFLLTKLIGHVDYLQYPHIAVVGLLSGLFLASFLLRTILYAIVNSVFFKKKKNEQFSRSWILLSVSEGLVLYPFVLLMVYGAFPVIWMLYLTLFVVILAKLLTFYKAFAIFFQRIDGFLQNILYFCALEIIPLAILGGGLIEMSKFLEITF